MSKKLKAVALGHTWNALGTEGQKLRLDVEEIERGVREHKPYRVAQGLMGMMSALPHALRLLGRLDQVGEDAELDGKPSYTAPIWEAPPEVPLAATLHERTSSLLCTIEREFDGRLNNLPDPRKIICADEVQLTWTYEAKMRISVSVGLHSYVWTSWDRDFGADGGEVFYDQLAVPFNNWVLREHIDTLITYHEPYAGA